MKQLDEDSKEFKELKKEWLKRAREMTTEKLPDFIRELTCGYLHDYGTICHATAIAAISAACSINHSNQGGITGFQAAAVSWVFIREWNCLDNKTGLKLIDYDNFLYPQYGDKLDKIISKDTWEDLQTQAAQNIQEYENEYRKYLKALSEFGKKLENFIERHPGYKHLPQYYEKSKMEYENIRSREIAGYEFAPRKPRDPRPHPDVVKHWKSIVAGKIPFDYKITKNE